jgi:hypothetical protein
MNFSPSPSAPFRFATLTSTARWEREKGNKTTTNIVSKVPNLFQDLTVTFCILPTDGDEADGDGAEESASIKAVGYAGDGVGFCGELNALE